MITHPHILTDKHRSIAAKGQAYLGHIAKVADQEHARMVQDASKSTEQGKAQDDLQSLAERHLVAMGVEFIRNAPNPTGRTFGYLMVPCVNGERLFIEFFHVHNAHHVAHVRKLYGKYGETVYVAGDSMSLLKVLGHVKARVFWENR